MNYDVTQYMINERINSLITESEVQCLRKQARLVRGTDDRKQEELFTLNSAVEMVTSWCGVLISLLDSRFHTHQKTKR